MVVASVVTSALIFVFLRLWTSTSLPRLGRIAFTSCAAVVRRGESSWSTQMRRVSEWQRSDLEKALVSAFTILGRTAT